MKPPRVSAFHGPACTGTGSLPAPGFCKRSTPRHLRKNLRNPFGDRETIGPRKALTLSESIESPAMPAEFYRVKELFLAALEKDQPGERSAYLEAACGRDLDLRQRVNALLARHEVAGSFLE